MNLKCDDCGNTTNFMRRAREIETRELINDVIIYYDSRGNIDNQEHLNTVTDEQMDCEIDEEGDWECADCESSYVVDLDDGVYINTDEEYTPSDEGTPGHPMRMTEIKYAGPKKNATIDALNKLKELTK